MWGTTEYFAPEVYERAYGFQADVWSLGCILYEMLTGHLAFPCRDRSLSLVKRALFHGVYKPKRLFEQRSGWRKLSREARSLIKGMLKRNPVKRLDIEECLSHPWLKLAEEEIVVNVDEYKSVSIKVNCDIDVPLPDFVQGSYLKRSEYLTRRNAKREGVLLVGQQSVVASVETESGEVRGEVSSVVSLVDKIPNRLKRDERLVRQTSKITKEDVGKFDTVPHVMSQKENEEVMDSHAKPLLAAQVGEGEETVIKSLEGAAKAREHIENDDEEEGKGKIRTATGGIVHSAIVLLTLFAFAGNAAFLVYVFWLSK
eukprot:scaffold2755_cov194-Ochromonas_danica.AAC.5